MIHFKWKADELCTFYWLLIKHLIILNCSFRSILTSLKSIFDKTMAGHFYAEFYDLSDCHMLLFMIIGIQFVMAIKLNKNEK